MEVLVHAFQSAISKETGVSLGDVGLDTSFTDLGVDPVMAMSILEAVHNTTGVELPASIFRGSKTLVDIQKGLRRHGQLNGHVKHLPRQPTVQEAFIQCSHLIEQFASEAGVSDFLFNVYPTQRQLVLAYITETLTWSGRPLGDISPGTQLTAPDSVVAQHRRLVNALFDILADGGLLEVCGDHQAIRTSKPVDSTPSKELYHKLLQRYPLHSNTHQLLNITGPQLASCLSGTSDPIKLLFGSKTGRHLLQEFYTNAPMFVAASKHLTTLFKNKFSSTSTDKCVEILEVGAGFGGTTTFMLDMLIKEGIPFKYTFTDISPAFFNAAKKRYAALSLPPNSISYEILDIEKDLAPTLHGRFDAVLSTNCIHATADLVVSCRNVRKLLRPGGFFSLIEFTTRLYWLDLVFGLLDGWWLFKDGRKHCIAGTSFWKTSLEVAGFSKVLWADALVGDGKPNPQVIVACTE